MEVSEILASAWVEVEKANLPEPVREVAFREAIRLIAAERVATTTATHSAVEEAPAKAARPLGKQTSRRVAPKKSEADAIGFPHVPFAEVLQKVEHETGVDQHRLEELLYVDNGVPCVNLPARRLGSTLTARAVVVALILTVVRHYGFDEDETSSRVVREELSRLKCLDEKNFSSHIKSVDGLLCTGPSNARVLKIRPQAVEKFVRIVGELLPSEATDQKASTPADQST